ncbi:Mn2+ and Fe2+ transporters of the NRAMP family [Brevibacterium aurantiacum]|uniref:Mn2+ and Fe2+ transporters of the NRAMP family n=1 Tax=Brevibacterium aurantiacum TaxID=273384 RepID=A0A2H1KSF7_BREAU|nr:Nramp family divalent metal transporter [Brevibacterium aurantiacum]SMY02484.1 Mn2+ and Fe2+ transporters of the NRAMP family [Brevibacterium aurantiacum]
MSAEITPQTIDTTTSAPSSLSGRLRLVGPGIVLALASVGASDMITTMNSGAEYGLALIWVFTVGIILKFVLSEAVSRLQMSDDRSLQSHLTSFGGRLFPSLFLVAELLVGLFFGAGVIAVTTNILQALFPVLPFWPTAVVVLLSAAILVGIGRYGLVEKAMIGFGVIMFFGILALAISVFQGQEAQAVAVETIAPTFPNGSIITVMSLIGGVGGATGILAYSFWIREKSWRDAEWKPVVRIDLFISYALVFVFAVGMSAVGAFILYGQGFTIADNDSLFAIADSLVSRIGEVGRILFLISFLAVVYTSVLGGFSGIAYVTADCIRVLRRYPHQDKLEHEMSAKSVEFRAAIVYLSIATLVIMGLGKPVTLVLIYAAISAFVLPVLAIALLVILNRSSVPAALRNKGVSNVLLTICFLLFGFLAVLQVKESVMGLLG